MSMNNIRDNKKEGGINPNRHFCLAFLGMVMVSTLAILFIFRRIFWEEMLLAWFLVSVNGLFTLGIHRTAIKNHCSKPVVWALGMNGLRTLIFAAILVFLSLWSMKNLIPFLVAVLIGYFIFLYTEIFNLHRLSSTIK